MALATRQKPNAHHRKRVAQHHRKDKPYLKTYWPYLPMLLIVGMGLIINTVWSNTNVLGSKSDFSSSSLLSETNLKRAESQQTALSLSPQLAEAAQAKANDMVKADYWSHNAPDGKTPWSFIAASGYQYQTAGENLAYGFDSASEAVKGWMNSQEHRDNILNASYREVGFGVASAPNYQGQGPQTVLVAEYGQPGGAAASPSEVQGAATPGATSQPVSRIQVLTGGQATWSALVISALAGAALALFIVRHGLRLHRVLVRGETFIARHAVLDIAIVFVFTAGFVLTRGSGIIG